MRIFGIVATVIMSGLLMAAPGFAQTSPAQKQKTEGADTTPSIGPGSMAYRQKTEGADTTTSIGPASGAYKQRTQSLSHAGAPHDSLAKQN
jgi:hypothetical protein